MTTFGDEDLSRSCAVVEAYRLDRYDNFLADDNLCEGAVVEAYRLDRYDNFPHR